MLNKAVEILVEREILLKIKNISVSNYTMIFIGVNEIIYKPFNHLLLTKATDVL